MTLCLKICVGFYISKWNGLKHSLLQHDPAPFKNLTRKGEKTDGKYPEMGWDFQSTTVKNLYYGKQWFYRILWLE